MTDLNTLALDDESIFRVPLVGPQLGEPTGRLAPSVDGVAIYLVDPRDSTPHIVFVNEGLQELTGRRVDQLLGQPATTLYCEDVGPIEWSEVRSALLGGHVHVHPEQTPGLPEAEPGPSSAIDGSTITHIDLSGSADEEARFAAYLDAANMADSRSDRRAHGPLRAPLSDATEEYSSFVSLSCANRTLLPVHACYTVVPSATPGAPYVVAQFRDMAKQSTERLLADKATIVGSLDRGHELGRLCHQICSQVETALGNDVRCALALTASTDRLETVVSGGMSVEVADQVFATMIATGKELIGRVVKVETLDEPLAARYEASGATSLWFVPLISLGATLRGAVLVASPATGPDTTATRILDHHVDLLTAAIEHSRAESAIAHHALHDSLTHLPNRALIVDRLGQALARMERDGVAMSALLVDIDRFRSVNDSRGVEAGDQVLVEVANRLLSAVRVGDTVGRVSSDQYLVICVATNGEIDAAGVAKRVLRLLDNPVQVAGGDPIRITASIGAVVVDEPGQSPTAVISKAETALAQATAEGRGQFAMYEDRHRQTVVARHELEQALSKAIENDELTVHYQPIVETRSGFMTAAEALLRWDRPGHGLIGPGAFIPVAEECELVVPMGEWVIDKVCEDMAEWPKSRGRSPMVSINLAARHLELDTLVPTVISALQRNGLEPPRLGFEITESMRIGNLAAATVNLRRLSQLGCRIAIDDFGIGHATLDYLRRFSMADVLKIDRSFIAGLGKSREDTAIVNASIALASSLKMQVIAEGVEYGSQLEALRELGCRYAQGFAFARAVPFDEILVLWDQLRLADPASPEIE